MCIWLWDFATLQFITMSASACFSPASLPFENTEPCHLEPGQSQLDLFLHGGSAVQLSPAYFPQLVPAVIGSAQTSRYLHGCSGESLPFIRSSIVPRKVLSLHRSAPCWPQVSYCTFLALPEPSAAPAGCDRDYTKGETVLSGWETSFIVLLLVLSRYIYI